MSNEKCAADEFGSPLEVSVQTKMGPITMSVKNPEVQKAIKQGAHPNVSMGTESIRVTPIDYKDYVR